MDRLCPAAAGGCAAGGRGAARACASRTAAIRGCGRPRRLQTCPWIKEHFKYYTPPGRGAATTTVSTRAMSFLSSLMRPRSRPIAISVSTAASPLRLVHSTPLAGTTARRSASGLRLLARQVRDGRARTARTHARTHACAHCTHARTARTHARTHAHTNLATQQLPSQRLAELTLSKLS